MEKSGTKHRLVQKHWEPPSTSSMVGSEMAPLTGFSGEIGVRGARTICVAPTPHGSS